MTNSTDHLIEIDVNEVLVDQLDFHWTQQLRPRLDGLSDLEYFAEPVPGCWSIRRRGASTASVQAGSGEFVIEFDYDEPVPPPVTTIAWRLGHIIVGVLGSRNTAHFAGPPVDYDSYRYAGTAAEALDQLDKAYDVWTAGVRALGAEGLQRPCGPAEGPFADRPVAELVLHINREVIHHGAEIAVLRDLWANGLPAHSA